MTLDRHPWYRYGVPTRVLMVALLLAASVCAWPAEADDSSCTGGRFVTNGASTGMLAELGTGAEPLEILLQDGVGLRIGACMAPDARITTKRGSLIVRARWTRCGNLTNVRFSGRLALRTCRTLVGQLAARGRKTRKVRAVASSCLDVPGAECFDLRGGLLLFSGCDRNRDGTIVYCVDCRCAVCGDGDIDPAGLETPAEECDGQALGACVICGEDCRCRQPVCGNNVVEPGEECDIGPLDPETHDCRGDYDEDALGACRGCRCYGCGNGRRDADLGEACDGEDAAACPGRCTADCDCKTPRCGDGIRDPDEQCDGTDLGPECTGKTCRSDCRCTGCTDSSECSTGRCCSPSSGQCCLWGGEPCDARGPSPFADASASCTVVPGTDPGPVNLSVCGSEAPTICPAQAKNPIWFECTRCRYGDRYIAQLCNPSTGVCTRLR